jgi:hypothetical protein
MKNAKNSTMNSKNSLRNLKNTGWTSFQGSEGQALPQPLLPLPRQQFFYFLCHGKPSVTNNKSLSFPSCSVICCVILRCKTAETRVFDFALVWVTHSIVNSKITVKSVLQLFDLLGARLASASSPKNTSLPHLLVCSLLSCLTNKKSLNLLC